MRAALEEYNQKLAHTDAVPLKSPDKQDIKQDGGRRRGATIIGARDYLGPILAGDANDHPELSSSVKDDGYNNIKLRYLRSLNISIATPTKDVQVSASAPIPIPIPLRHKDDSDTSDEEDDHRRNQIDDDDNDYLGENDKFNTNNYNNSNNNDFMIGTPEISHMPVRKDSKSKAKPKFIPPHELLGNANNDETLVNHSLPGNHRRKVFGQ